MIYFHRLQNWIMQEQFKYVYINLFFEIYFETFYSHENKLLTKIKWFTVILVFRVEFYDVYPYLP